MKAWSLFGLSEHLERLSKTGNLLEFLEAPGRLQSSIITSVAHGTLRSISPPSSLELHFSNIF